MFTIIVLWFSLTFGASPIAKALVMLTKLKENCERDALNEAALHEKYKQWCDEDEVKNTVLIARTKQHIDERTAFLEEQHALQITYRTDVAMIAQDISRTEEHFRDANVQRNKEHAQFVSADKAFVNAMSQLTAAITELGTPIPAARVAMLRTEFHTLLTRQRAEHQVPSLHRFFTSLLNGHAQAQSQADVSNGSAQRTPVGRMRGLVTLLKDIQRDVEHERVFAQKAEAKALAAHKLRVQALPHDVATLNRQKKEKQRQLHFSLEQCAVATKEKATSDKLLAETQRYARSTALQCEDQDRMYKERVALRGEEINAIEQAMYILQSDGGRTAKKAEAQGKTSFVSAAATQAINTMSRQRLSRVGAARDRPRGERAVTTFLQAREHRHTPFVKVKKTIEGMIVKLLDEASGEVEQKQWCDKETSQTKRQHQHHAHIISKLTSQVKETDADYAITIQNIQNAQNELTSLAQSFKEAAKIRQKEHDAAVEVIQESDESQQLLQRAIGVLQAYYEKHDSAFLQQAQKLEGGYEGKHGVARGIIDVLEMSLTGFARLESETKLQEARAQREYEQFVQDSTKRRELTKADIGMLTKDKAKLETLQIQIRQDLKEQETEFYAVSQYLEKLAAQCDFRGPNMQDRHERREKEINSLQNALAIINGYAVPA